MSNRFKIGDIVELYNDEEKKYVVYRSVLQDNEEYLILNPFVENKEKTITFNINEMMIIKPNVENEPFEYITDLETIKRIVSTVIEDDSKKKQ